MVYGASAATDGCSEAASRKAVHRRTRQRASACREEPPSFVRGECAEHSTALLLRRNQACNLAAGAPTCAARQGVRACLIAICLASVLPGGGAITCYKSDVIYDSEKFTLNPSAEMACPATALHCITRTYTQGFVAHDCSKGFENCTALGVEKAGVDLTGEHTYSCCNTDKCNTKELRLPDIAIATNFQVVRPQCEAWMPKNYDLNEKDYATKASDVKQGFVKENADQRSQWSLGVQPPTASSWLFTRDTSSPTCYIVAGQIRSGFCGVRYNMESDGNKAKDQFGDLDVTFEGKYYNSYCGGSRSEKLALADDFTLVNRDLDREKCMSMLLESTLKSDCESIGGQFNLDVFVRRRRNLLPDCCVGYIEVRAKDRLVCDCTADGSITLTGACAQVCCCEEAIMGKVPEDRCRVVEQYIDLTKELELVLRDQCCFTRMLSQCQTAEHCNDAVSDVGRVASLSSFPMCCNECEDYYDQICSYNMMLPTGEEGARIRMKSAVLGAGLLDLCQRKLCRTQYPCSFTRHASGALPQARSSLIPSLLSLSLFALILPVD